MRFAKTFAALAIVPIALAFAAPALAANFEVKMLNSGEMGPMVFEPALLKIAPGDSVTFVPTTKMHNAETIPGLLPEGATPFKSKQDETITVTFTVPGAYGIECEPHYKIGMIALIVVGDAPANLDAFKTTSMPNRAHERFDILLRRLADAE